MEPPNSLRVNRQSQPTSTSLPIPDQPSSLTREQFEKDFTERVSLRQVFRFESGNLKNIWRHILLAPALSQTPYEGGYGVDQTKYWKSYLDFEPKTTPLTDIEKKAITKVVEDFSGYYNTKEELAYIKEKLKAPGDYCYIPSGFTGHFMVIKIKCIAPGKYELYFLNKGSGADRHQDAVKREYRTLKDIRSAAYEIVGDEQLESVVSKLNDCSNGPAPSPSDADTVYDIPYLYGNRSVHYLPQPDDYYAATSQRSGNCTEANFEAAFVDALREVDNQVDRFQRKMMILKLKEEALIHWVANAIDKIKENKHPSDEQELEIQSEVQHLLRAIQYQSNRIAKLEGKIDRELFVAMEIRLSVLKTMISSFEKAEFTTKYPKQQHLYFSPRNIFTMSKPKESDANVSTHQKVFRLLLDYKPRGRGNDLLLRLLAFSHPIRTIEKPGSYTIQGKTDDEIKNIINVFIGHTTNWWVEEENLDEVEQLKLLLAVHQNMRKYFGEGDINPKDFYARDLFYSIFLKKAFVVFEKLKEKLIVELRKKGVDVGSFDFSFHFPVRKREFEIDFWVDESTFSHMEGVGSTPKENRFDPLFNDVKTYLNDRNNVDPKVRVFLNAVFALFTEGERQSLNGNSRDHDIELSIWNLLKKKYQVLANYLSIVRLIQGRLHYNRRINSNREDSYSYEEHYHTNYLEPIFGGSSIFSISEKLLKEDLPPEDLEVKRDTEEDFFRTQEEWTTTMPAFASTYGNSAEVAMAWAMENLDVLSSNADLMREVERHLYLRGELQQALSNRPDETVDLIYKFIEKCESYAFGNEGKHRLALWILKVKGNLLHTVRDRINRSHPEWDQTGARNIRYRELLLRDLEPETLAEIALEWATDYFRHPPVNMESEIGYLLEAMRSFSQFNKNLFYENSYVWFMTAFTFAMAPNIRSVLENYARYTPEKLKPILETALTGVNVDPSLLEDVTYDKKEMAFVNKDRTFTFSITGSVCVGNHELINPLELLSNNREQLQKYGVTDEDLNVEQRVDGFFYPKKVNPFVRFLINDGQVILQKFMEDRWWEASEHFNALEDGLRRKISNITMNEGDYLLFTDSGEVLFRWYDHSGRQLRFMASDRRLYHVDQDGKPTELFYLNATDSWGRFGHVCRHVAYLGINYAKSTILGGAVLFDLGLEFLYVQDPEEPWNEDLITCVCQTGAFKGYIAENQQSTPFSYSMGTLVLVHPETNKKVMLVSAFALKSRGSALQISYDCDMDKLNLGDRGTNYFVFTDAEKGHPYTCSPSAALYLSYRLFLEKKYLLAYQYLRHSYRAGGVEGLDRTILQSTAETNDDSPEGLLYLYHVYERYNHLLHEITPKSIATTFQAESTEMGVLDRLSQRDRRAFGKDSKEIAETANSATEKNQLLFKIGKKLKALEQFVSSDMQLDIEIFPDAMRFELFGSDVSQLPILEVESPRTPLLTDYIAKHFGSFNQDEFKRKLASDESHPLNFKLHLPLLGKTDTDFLRLINELFSGDSQRRERAITEIVWLCITKKVVDRSRRYDDYNEMSIIFLIWTSERTGALKPFSRLEDVVTHFGSIELSKFHYPTLSEIFKELSVVKSAMKKNVPSLGFARNISPKARVKVHPPLITEFEIDSTPLPKEHPFKLALDMFVEVDLPTAQTVPEDQDAQPSDPLALRLASDRHEAFARYTEENKPVVPHKLVENRTINELKSYLEQEFCRYYQRKASIKEEIMKLVQYEGRSSDSHHILSEIGQHLSPIEWNNLLKAYLSGNPSELLLKNKNLNEGKLKQIFTKLNEYLEVSTLCDQALEAKRECDKCSGLQGIELDVQVDKIYGIIAHKRAFTVNYDNRFLLYFEALSGVRLRPDQYKAITWALEAVDAGEETFSARLLQAYAGFGKTKVFSTILAFMIREKGKIPTVYQIPQLFDLGSSELATALMASFKVLNEEFDLPLSTDLSKLRTLERMRDHLKEVLRHRKVLVAKPLSWHKLNAEYKRLLSAQAEDETPYQQKKIEVLREIMNFYKANVFSVYDEGHLIFSPLQDVNIATGSLNQIPQDQRDLIKWNFEQLLEIDRANPGQRLFGIVENRQVYASDEIRKEATRQIIERAVERFGKLNVATEQQLRDLFTQEGNTKPQWLKELAGGNAAANRIANLIALQYGFIKKLLNGAFGKQDLVDYGDSIFPNDPTVAPKDKKRSTEAQFEKKFVTAHFTIQHIYQKVEREGIDFNQFIALFDLLQKEVETSGQDQYGSKIYQILQRKKLDKLAEKFSLISYTKDRVNLNNQLYRALKQEPFIRDLFIDKIALPAILTASHNITSKPSELLQHGVMLTATPRKLETLPLLLSTPENINNQKLDLASEQATRIGMVAQRNNRVRVINLVPEISSYFEAFSDDEIEEIGHIIDGGRMFDQFTEEQVARAFLQRSTFPRYVVFTKTVDGTRADFILKPDGTVERLNSSDIEEEFDRLQIPKKMLPSVVYYYSLQETTGKDWKLPTNTTGIFTVGPEHGFNEAVQNFKRDRRALEPDKSIIYLMSTEVKERISKDTMPSAEQIVCWMEDNDAREIRGLIQLRFKQEVESILSQHVFRRVEKYPKLANFFLKVSDFDPLDEFFDDEDAPKTYLEYAIREYKKIGYTDSIFAILSESERVLLEQLIEQTVAALGENIESNKENDRQQFVNREQKQQKVQEKQQERLAQKSKDYTPRALNPFDWSLSVADMGTPLIIDGENPAPTGSENDSVKIKGLPKTVTELIQSKRVIFTRNCFKTTKGFRPKYEFKPELYSILEWVQPEDGPAQYFIAQLSMTEFEQIERDVASNKPGTRNRNLAVVTNTSPSTVRLNISGLPFADVRSMLESPEYKRSMALILFLTQYKIDDPEAFRTLLTDASSTEVSALIDFAKKYPPAIKRELPIDQVYNLAKSEGVEIVEESIQKKMAERLSSRKFTVLKRAGKVGLVALVSLGLVASIFVILQIWNVNMGKVSDWFHDIEEVTGLKDWQILLLTTPLTLGIGVVYLGIQYYRKKKR